MKEEAEKLLLMSWDDSLVFTKDGVWLHNGEPITHAGIADYFSSRLRYSREHQTYVVAAEGRSVRAVVEDTPVVVRTLAGDAETGWTALLSGGKTESLQCGTLSVTGAGEWYCLTGPEGTRTRLLRPAIQHLAPSVEEEEGRFVLVTAKRTYPLRSE